jgi:hypothetical protein
VPAYYSAVVRQFLQDDSDTIIGRLTYGSEQDRFHALILDARRAWEKELHVLRVTLAAVVGSVPNAADWGLLLEYPIPRRQKRIDALLFADELILVIEFKTEEDAFKRADIAQVEDYALDLQDFHEQSRNKRLFPILVSTEAPVPISVGHAATEDLIQPVRLANAETLAGCVLEIYQQCHRAEVAEVNYTSWECSAYRPVPNIIEAAEMLFAQHSVRDIAHAHADARNLAETSQRLIEAARYAQTNYRKLLCLVTGVPGSGKTLAGLNVVHNKELRGEGRSAGVFLTGNGPLVRIVSEALVRDHARREGMSRREARHKISTFIQNVHEFFKFHYDKQPNDPPPDHVVIFDEAQRAWDLKKELQKWHRQISEPEMMLQIMDRHEWAVVIALVGGGQEIHDGEAGLAEWGRAISQSYRHWGVLTSPEAVQGGESVAGSLLFENGVPENVEVRVDEVLHLPVSIRSYRAEHVAAWVNAILKGNVNAAAAISRTIEHFPIKVTRSLEVARTWLRQQTRGNRRCGLVASSGAKRLRPYGIEVSSGFTQGYPWEEWFLAPMGDVRSSLALEVAATEFQCQGLELDWVGLCWADDLTFSTQTGSWRYRDFRGSKWQQIKKEIDRHFLLNKYRVLLTRAREGMVIWIPDGSADDPTRAPALLDETAAYLKKAGAAEL